MSYDAELLLDQARTLLAQTPGLSLAPMAHRLGFSPRGLRRALAERGFTFRRLRMDWVLREADRLRRGIPGISDKQIAESAGYSQGGFCRLCARTRPAALADNENAKEKPADPMRQDDNDAMNKPLAATVKFLAPTVK